jgi:hypothetical protein
MRAHGIAALAAIGALLALAGCANVLGIDGPYGDEATAGDGAVEETSSPLESGAPDVVQDSTPVQTGSDGAATDTADADAAPRDAGHPDGQPAPRDASAQPDADAAPSGPPPVTASNRRLAFGPSADGSGAASVFGVGSDGTVSSWTFGATMTAKPAAGVPAATTIAGGAHACVVAASDSSLWCWGPGSPPPTSATPVQVAGTGTGQWVMRGVTGGDTFTCILDDKGTVGCAGTLAGWTSPGGALSYPVFTGGMFASTELFDATDVSAAGGVVCVVNHTPSSGLFCWGSNADLVAAPTGKAGSTQAYPWVVLTSPQDPVSVSVSPSHACSVYEQGGAGASRVVCWGAVPESSGGLQSWDPLPYDGIGSVVTTGVPGTEATFLVTPDGGVAAAGTWPADAGAGLLGASYPEGSTTFVGIPELTGVTQLVASGTEACALLEDGAIECWGSIGSVVVAPTRVGGLP